ncbi:MAG: glucosaminidase domain-containing protein [Candidatus Riflebacteria bacterium]
MRKFRKLALLMALVSSVFMVGCDASKIMEVITKVAEGIQKAAPAIKEVINTVSGALNNNANAAENNTNTNNTAETNTNDNANVTVNTAGDQEDLNTNDNTNTNTNTNTNANTDTGSASAAEAALANYKGGRLSPTEFKNLFGPVAREVSKKSGVPASIILAQAALETGWGGSAIGDAKNLFGIKGTGPAGSIRVPTKEVINGRTVTINDNFRKYNTWMESLEDHSRLLQTSRYANCMRYKNDPDQFARELQKAGYATDPSYASKLISIMKSNNLYAYNN